jgi:hypothetical protein
LLNRRARKAAFEQELSEDLRIDSVPATFSTLGLDYVLLNRRARKVAFELELSEDLRIDPVLRGSRSACYE